MNQKAPDENLYVEQIIELPFNESAGKYISIFLTKIRDEGKIVANKCPVCHRIVLPPRIVCAYDKVEIEDKPENWVELSDKGTVTDCVGIDEREVDTITGEFVGTPNPILFVRLDGGDEWTILGHIAEEMDVSKYPRGARVQAVWKPQQERQGKTSDIKFFRLIKE
jgi:uncharacterized OB-fold protein